MKNITKELLQEVVSKCENVNQCLQCLNLSASSASYRQFYKQIAEDEINIKHFKKHINTNKKTSDNEAFSENSTYSRKNLKKRILKNNLIKYECCICKTLPVWQDKELSLILDHINGINNDNRLENLRFICPNCNSQLNTHCGKLTQKEKESRRIEKERLSQEGKQKELLRRIKTRKVARPSKEQLLADVDSLGYVGTGKKYGVCDNSIRHWLKSPDIELS